MPRCVPPSCAASRRPESTWRSRAPSRCESACAPRPTTGPTRESIGLAASYQDLRGTRRDRRRSLRRTANEVIVQEQAAADLGLEVGEQLLIDGARFTVVGTWRAVDYLDPRWYGDPMIATGLNEDHGPFVIDEGAWSRFDDDCRACDGRSSRTSPTSPRPTSPRSPTHGSPIDSDWRGEVDGLETLEKQGRFAQTAASLGVRVTGLARDPAGGAAAARGDRDRRARRARAAARRHPRGRDRADLVARRVVRATSRPRRPSRSGSPPSSACCSAARRASVRSCS